MEILNIFIRSIFGILYDKIGFKYSMFICNTLSLLFIIITYFGIENSYFFGIVVGLNNFIMSGHNVILNSAA